MAEPLTDEGAEETGVPRKKPDEELKKMHILKHENSNPTKHSNPHSSSGGRLGKQTW